MQSPGRLKCAGGGILSAEIARPRQNSLPGRSASVPDCPFPFGTLLSSPPGSLSDRSGGGRAFGPARLLSDYFARLLSDYFAQRLSDYSARPLRITCQSLPDYVARPHLRPDLSEGCSAPILFRSFSGPPPTLLRSSSIPPPALFRPSFGLLRGETLRDRLAEPDLWPFLPVCPVRCGTPERPGWSRGRVSPDRCGFSVAIPTGHESETGCHRSFSCRSSRGVPVRPPSATDPFFESSAVRRGRGRNSPRRTPPACGHNSDGCPSFFLYGSRLRRCR